MPSENGNVLVPERDLLNSPVNYRVRIDTSGDEVRVVWDIGPHEPAGKRAGFICQAP